MQNLTLPLLALVTFAAPSQGDGRPDADQVRAVTETFLKNQASPTRCDANLGLCLEGAVFLVTHKKSGKVDVPRTIQQLSGYIKGTLKVDQKLTLHSVMVEVKENTGLAVAFSSFQVDETSCYSVFILAKRDGKWKVLSVTQENR